MPELKSLNFFQKATGAGSRSWARGWPVQNSSHQQHCQSCTEGDQKKYFTVIILLNYLLKNHCILDRIIAKYIVTIHNHYHIIIYGQYRKSNEIKHFEFSIQCYIFEDSFSKLNSSTKVSFKNTLVLGDLSIYLLNVIIWKYTLHFSCDIMTLC